MGGLVQALNYPLQQVHKRRIRPTAIKCDRYRSAVVYIAILLHLQTIMTPAVPLTRAEAQRRCLAEVPDAFPEAFKQAWAILHPCYKRGRGRPIAGPRSWRLQKRPNPRLNRRTRDCLANLRKRRSAEKNREGRSAAAPEATLSGIDLILVNIPKHAIRRSPPSCVPALPEFAIAEAAYGKTISTRRFCRSRTPGAQSRQ
jgi:hypothetical protein